MMAQAAPVNATGLLIGRYFLGLAEGSAYPAAIVLISIWYRKAEHAGRFAALYGADIIAQGIGGMMLFGFSSIQGPIAGWRIAMIIAGCMTIVIGTLFAWLIPSKMRLLGS
jgi:ACS family allantoate permease-like MFS transporter